MTDCATFSVRFIIDEERIKNYIRKINSLAFLCISTGIYGYPKKLAAEVAVKTCTREQNNSSPTIIFCCFEQENYEIYQDILSTNMGCHHS